MFERLHRAIIQVIPQSKGVALIVTLTTVGVGSFIPYYVEQITNADDELRVEYIFQRDRIKTLKEENDSLQKLVNQQSVEYSRELHETIMDFNKRLHELEEIPKKKRIHPPPPKVHLPKLDNHGYQIDVSKSMIIRKFDSLRNDSIKLKLVSQMKDTILNKIDSSKFNTEKHKTDRTHNHKSKTFFNFLKQRKQKSIKSFNPDRTK